MDAAALHTLSTQTALRGLARNRHLLDLIDGRGDAARLLSLRLAPDQFDCAEQIRTVTIFALRTTMPLVGRPWTLANWDANAPALRAQITGAARAIAALTVDDFADAPDRTITHKAGDAVLNQTAQDYLIQFAAPNLWFHLSMAYAILRQNGVPVGKADFDGLHAYPADFSFV